VSTPSSDWEAFRRQALSDLDMFDLVLAQRAPQCHHLHYLQMAAEKAGRAIRNAVGQDGAAAPSHAAIVMALRVLRTHRRTRDVLFRGDRRRQAAVFAMCLPLAHDIERIAPAIARNGPNPEYPWSTDGRLWTAPCDHAFTLTERLTRPAGVAFARLLRQLLENLPQVLAN
jgi:hypothetical protein